MLNQGVAAILTLGVGQQALAQGGASAQAQVAAPKGVTQPMHLAAAQEVVSAPDGDGNVQVKLSNGQVIAVPATLQNAVLHPTAPASTDAGTSPDGIVFGNCGYSYINLGYKSNGAPVRMTTGFHTYWASKYYGWLASISGPNYYYTYRSSGGLRYRYDWSGSHDSSANYPHGWYTARVSTWSYAVLWWGGICVSGGPVQVTHL